MRAGASALALLALALAAGPARAADYTLDDVTLASKAASYRAKRVEVTGAALSREDALKLLSADNPESAAERFAKLDAARIVIPELVSETKGAGYTQTLTYRNLALDRVTHGRADVLDIAETLVDSQGGLTSNKGRMGAMHAEGVDFPAMAQMTLQARTNADEKKRGTTESFTLDGMEIELADGGKIVAGRISGRDFSGRPLAASMSSLVDMSAKPEGGALSATTGRAIALMMNDLIVSVDIGALEIDDVDISKKADAKGSAASVRIKKFAIGGLMDGKFGSIALEGVENLAGDDLFRFDRLAIAGLDVRPVLKAAATAPDAGAPSRATPQFDKIDMDGLSMSVDGAPLKASHVSILARDWLDVAPGAVDLRIQNAIVSLAGPGASRSPALAALGYDKLDLSSAFDARLDPAKNELSLKEISASDPDIGGLRLSATLNHVSPDLLSGDPEKARIALATMVFWRADLHIENHGLLDKFVAAQAKQSGKSVAAVRDELATAAHAMARTLFGAKQKSDPQLDRVGDAAAKFVMGAKSLNVRMFAPEGLGAVDLMMGAQLGVLADRVKIEAETH